MLVAEKNKVYHYSSFHDLMAESVVLFENSQVVHCHGVFDLLHIGHIRHFKEAKAKGDILVVSITADEYVNKGPDRPVFSQNLRAEAIAALDVVDYVVINNHPTAIEIIKLIKPNVYIKGIEYKTLENDLTGKIQDEEAAVNSVGGNVVFTDDITFSSSSLINQFFPSFPPGVMQYLSHFKKKFNSSDIFSCINASQQLKVAVIGESIIDEYVFCDAMGKAGKEPVLVAKNISSEKYAGGVLAIANHLSDFVSEVDCFTYFGEQAGYESLAKSKIKENVNLQSIYKSQSPTIVKRRFVDNYLRQKLFEVYEINDSPIDGDNKKQFLSALSEQLENYDVVIVADYGHGLLDQDSIAELSEKSKFLAVNVQANAGNHGFNCIDKYPKADYVCIAQRELDLTFRKRNRNPEDHLNALVQSFAYKNIMVTSGRNGCLSYKEDHGSYHVPALATTVTDRVGAGDSVLALTSLLVAVDSPVELIGFVGNVVGAEAVTITGNSRFIEKVALMKHISHLLK